ncbi:MAG: aminotransferase class III-fold pyridoxal phosphate-dependent enzyme [Steroidobacteraceae bacterium]
MTTQSTAEPLSLEIEQFDRKDVMHGFATLNAQATNEVVVMTEAKGMRVIDHRGREFLDAGGGLWCMNVGYGRQVIADVAAKQMAKLPYFHTFGNFSNEPMARLSDRLLKLAPPGMTRVVFASSGSEANDTQIKTVRRYNNLLGRPTKKKIIARLSSYHGSTVAAGSLSGLPMMHRTFDLPIPGILHTLATDYHRRPAGISTPGQFTQYLIDDLVRLIETEGPDTIAAFIAEPVCGSGGVLVPPEDYFSEVSKVLDRYDVLMIADEVITGFGRTGSWFASPELGIKPDLMSIAKGLTSGYFPMSGCLLSAKVADVLYADKSADAMFAHGFTWSGHPVGAAIAHANLDIMEQERLPENAARIGAYLIDRLRSKLAEHPLVGEIRGRGLLIGVELDGDRATRRPFAEPHRVASLVSRACFEERLLVRGGHGRVLAALAPPLIATVGDADEIVARLGRVLDRVAGEAKQAGLSA